MAPEGTYINILIFFKKCFTNRYETNQNFMLSTQHSLVLHAVHTTLTCTSCCPPPHSLVLHAVHRHTHLYVMLSTQHSLVLHAVHRHTHLYFMLSTATLTCTSCCPPPHSLVLHAIHRHTHVPRLLGARVQVSIVFWQQINIMEDVALIWVQFYRLQRSHVHQKSTVELAATCIKCTLITVLEWSLSYHNWLKKYKSNNVADSIDISFVYKSILFHSY